MRSIEHTMTVIYYLVDNYLLKHPRVAQWRTSNNPAQPNVSDAEVLTVALLQGPLGAQSLKQTWALVHEYQRDAFPKLPDYAPFVQRLHALDLPLGGLLAATTARPTGSLNFHRIDAKPIPLCQPLRHGRVRLLREAGAWFGKTSKGWFFGYQMHVLQHASGRIVNAVLLPGNWDEHDAELLLAQATDGGILLGDYGYRGENSRDLLWEEADLLLLTTADSADHKARKRLLSQVRQEIETCFSQLWYKFIDRVFSRSWQGLWNTLRLKLIYYNLCNAGVLSY
jgi:hypothetical protein